MTAGGSISPAMITGLAAFILAPVLSVFQIQWAAIPLTLFVAVSLGASLCPTLSFFLPVVCRGKTGLPVVALTFDDGPDPQTTLPLLKLLDRYDVKAAFFVTGENVLRHGEVLSRILEGGHDIGNHSCHHDPLLMLRSSATLAREIESMQALLKRFGIAPVAFRPPVGVTNPKLGRILRKTGMYCLTFSCRAGDFGNRRLGGLSRRILGKVKADDIILLHDVLPGEKKAAALWLQEVELILSGLRCRGLRVIPLADLVGRPIMRRIDEKNM